jgi:hypothetical protein
MIKKHEIAQTTDKISVQQQQTRRWSQISTVLRHYSRIERDSSAKCLAITVALLDGDNLQSCLNVSNTLLHASNMNSGYRTNVAVECVFRRSRVEISAPKPLTLTDLSWHSSVSPDLMMGDSKVLWNADTYHTKRCYIAHNRHLHTHACLPKARHACGASPFVVPPMIHPTRMA